MGREWYNELKKENIMEHWKSIAGYEELYEVSDIGRVKSLKYGKEKILKPWKTHKGYIRVNLYKDGQRKMQFIHRLVAEAFIPNPNNLETINHKDEDKTNNTVINLEWMSREDNNNYGTRNKRAGEAISKANINNPMLSKKVQMFDKFTGELLAIFPSTMEAERVTGIANQHISKCCNGKLKSAGGYIWKYLDNISEE